MNTPTPQEVNWNSATAQIDARTLRDAQFLANVIETPVYVVAENDRYLIRDATDLAVYGGSNDVVATFAPEADPPEGPIIDTEPPEPPVYPEENGYAVTLQSLLITQKMRRCLNCGEAHRTWQCGEIRAALFAPDPWKDVALGRELCRMRWQRFEQFKILIAQATRETLLCYAASYQAFIRDYAPDSDLTITHILAAWAKIASVTLQEAV